MAGEAIVVVGAGIFGVTAAIELRRRGHDVTLIDPGPVPHPLAESTDISKVVRLDYGNDAGYLALMERAIEGWRRWNAAWGEPLFHETGVTFLARSPMAPGGFEYESWRALEARGHRVERLDAAAIRARFPAWSTGAFVDGYFNPAGGYAESGRVVARLAREAEAIGVEVRARTSFARLHEVGSRVGGVVTREGEVIAGARVVIAAGTWTGHLLPWLRGCLRSVGQPVFHLLPPEPALFEAARFPVFGADIARTGYYGFPRAREGVVKIANHGVGREVDPGQVDRAEGDPAAAPVDSGPRAAPNPGDRRAPERVVSEEQEAALRAFLRDTFPALAEAPIVKTRVCVYGDTWDGHFWISSDPAREGLVVAAGGSGHGFKFAPVLGALIADAALGVPDPELARFRWRPELRSPQSEEAARHQG